MKSFSIILNALVIFVLAGVQFAAFGIQIFEGEEPCPLCFLQRLGMTGVASSLLLNLFFGIRPSHYGLALLSCLMGGFVALRQISLHVCPGFSTFGVPVLGLSLYTWSFIIFASTVLAVAFLLFLYDPKDTIEEKSSPNTLARIAFWTIGLATIGNLISTLFLCGFGPCH